MAQKGSKVKLELTQEELAFVTEILHEEYEVNPTEDLGVVIDRCEALGDPTYTGKESGRERGTY